MLLFLIIITVLTLVTLYYVNDNLKVYPMFNYDLPWDDVNDIPLGVDYAPNVLNKSPSLSLSPSPSPQCSPNAVGETCTPYMVAQTCGVGQTCTPLVNKTTIIPNTSPQSSPIAQSPSPQSSAKVNPNTASKQQLIDTFTKNGISRPEQWAREVDEYKPYPDSEYPQLTRLRKELTKYRPTPDTLEKIIASLTNK